MAMLEVEAVIPANPRAIFEAWLTAQQHTAMTGSPATVAADGSFTAWDGYISGRTIEAVAHERIVQRWRSTDFPSDVPDSRLEVHLTPKGRGTLVRIVHLELPPGQEASYADGWREFYLVPMKAHFGRRASGPGQAARPALRGKGATTRPGRARPAARRK